MFLRKNPFEYTRKCQSCLSTLAGSETNEETIEIGREGAYLKIRQKKIYFY